jgi:hypothetical protein
MEAKMTGIDCSCGKHSLDETAEECQANILKLIVLKKRTNRTLSCKGYSKSVLLDDISMTR